MEIRRNSKGEVLPPLTPGSPTYDDKLNGETEQESRMDTTGNSTDSRTAGKVEPVSATRTVPLSIVLNSVEMLLEDARRADAESDHEQRENWRYGHIATIAHWFGPWRRMRNCAATLSTDPPMDCNWPFCGCDPYAEKVLAAIEESGRTSSSVREAQGTAVEETSPTGNATD